MKYWEIIADNLSKAGWSWGCVVSAVDPRGRPIFIGPISLETSSISANCILPAIPQATEWQRVAD